MGEQLWRLQGAHSPLFPLLLPWSPLEGLMTAPDCAPHFLFCLLAKRLSSCNLLIENIWAPGRTQKREPAVRSPGIVENPRPLLKAGTCSVRGACHTGSDFLKSCLSGSSQCVLYKGISIPLAFANTLRFQRRLKVGLCDLATVLEQVRMSQGVRRSLTKGLAPSHHGTLA